MHDAAVAWEVWCFAYGEAEVLPAVRKKQSAAGVQGVPDALVPPRQQGQA